MRYPAIAALVGALALAEALPTVASAEVLISESEAKLPPPADTGMTTRGLTRGPGIELVSPTQGTPTRAPLPFKIKFVARNNVAIDPGSVKLTYMRLPAIDLTDRVRPFLSPDGIDMAKAEVPPGNHLIRVDVKDAEGRTNSMTITLSVAQ